MKPHASEATRDLPDAQSGRRGPRGGARRGHPGAPGPGPCHQAATMQASGEQAERWERRRLRRERVTLTGDIGPPRRGNGERCEAPTPPGPVRDPEGPGHTATAGQRQHRGRRPWALPMTTVDRRRDRRRREAPRGAGGTSRPRVPGRGGTCGLSSLSSGNKAPGSSPPQSAAEAGRPHLGAGRQTHVEGRRATKSH